MIWFLFFIGLTFPVLAINPYLESGEKRHEKRGFGYIMAICGCTFAFIVFINIALSLLNIKIFDQGKVFFITGEFFSMVLTFAFTGKKVWNYLVPAIKSMAIFIATITTNYIFPALKWCFIKIYEMVTKKKYTSKIKAEKNTEEEEKQKNEEPPKTKREKSIDDILNKLDNL